MKRFLEGDQHIYTHSLCFYRTWPHAPFVTGYNYLSWLVAYFSVAVVSLFPCMVTTVVDASVVATVVVVVALTCAGGGGCGGCAAGGGRGGCAAGGGRGSCAAAGGCGSCAAGCGSCAAGGGRGSCAAGGGRGSCAAGGGCGSCAAGGGCGSDPQRWCWCCGRALLEEGVCPVVREVLLQSGRACVCGSFFGFVF